MNRKEGERDVRKEGWRERRREGGVEETEQVAVCRCVGLEISRRSIGLTRRYNF